MSDRDQRLQAEADLLHRVLFGEPAPAATRVRFADLMRCRSLPDNLDVVELAARGVDLEALELAMRRRDPRNLLSQRFHALCYLAEARPDHFDLFVNRDAGWTRAMAVLTLHVLRSACKLIRGKWQMRAHGLG